MGRPKFHILPPVNKESNAYSKGSTLNVSEAHCAEPEQDNYSVSGTYYTCIPPESLENKNKYP